LPAEYQRKARDRLQAGSTILPLEAYYYAAGMRLAVLRGDRELMRLLQTVFAERYRDVFDTSFNLRNTDLSVETAKLTAVEQQLFRAGNLTSTELERWRSGQLSRIEASPAVRLSTARTIASTTASSVSAAVPPDLPG